MKRQWICLLTAVALLLSLWGCGEAPDVSTSPMISTTVRTTTTTTEQTTTTTDAAVTAKPVIPPEQMGRVVWADFFVTLAGVVVQPGDDAAPILAALGEPDSVNESISGGYWTERSIQYVYPGLVIHTEKHGERHEISSVSILNTDYALYKGTTCGYTRQEIREQYGEPTYDEEYHMSYDTQQNGNVYSLWFDFSTVDENDGLIAADTVQRVDLSTDAYTWGALDG